MDFGTWPATERENKVAILSALLPAFRLPQSCEKWANFVNILESYDELERDAPTFSSLGYKTSFSLDRDYGSCCVFCSSLREIVEKVYSVEKRSSKGARGIGGLEVGLKAFDQVYVETREFVLKYRVFVPGPSGPTSSPWHCVFPSPPEARHPLDKIHGIVTRCDSLHRCYGTEAGKKTTLLPTRVLDVSAGVASIRLRQHEAKGRYICLSHCWGSKQPLQTTASNIKDYQRNIPWDVVPVVYREAIEICWKLGVEYIWIDSLCIIQDSKEDWVQESQKMCDIYANSYLTVSATSSPDCSVSMMDGYQQRTQDMTVRHEVALSKPSQEFIFMRRKTSHWDTDNELNQLATEWPLKTRAWAFQEHMLSPRLVQFTHTDIIWQCLRGTTCDCSGANSLGETAVSFHMEMDPEPDSERSPQHFTESQRVAMLWWEVVEGYSKCQLTYETDKLPALSGLAHKFAQKRPGAAYLAGAWKDDDLATLLLDLMWCSAARDTKLKTLSCSPSSPSSSSSSGQKFVAPSFSWASTKGGVYFALEPQYELVDPYVEILESHCERSTSDPMGQVSSGLLKIKGKALRGRVSVGTRLGAAELLLRIGNGPLEDVMDSSKREGFIPDVIGDALWEFDAPYQREKIVDVVCVPWAKFGVIRNSASKEYSRASYVAKSCFVVLHHEGIGKGEKIEDMRFRRVGMLIRFNTFMGDQKVVNAQWAKPPSFLREPVEEDHVMTIV